MADEYEITANPLSASGLLETVLGKQADTNIASTQATTGSTTQALTGTTNQGRLRQDFSSMRPWLPLREHVLANLPSLFLRVQ